ncbi:kinase-like domain-containing protein [Aspergillus tamarii]|uniref:Kinase-like domain-containing protein n=1 Tax=Aspergillus tamarii TaxID=41984 RepID=A0A5N6UYF8_ASPTM|nr:kinase-like domain-containing protein [Aspergillus tamarii]
MSTPLRAFSRGLELTGKSKQKYTLLEPLLHREEKPSNVWSAARENDPTDQFIIKQPDTDDGPEWPYFTKEMEMQELFRKSHYIRRIVDVIPPSLDSEPPCMVLEAFEESLWSARLRRPFSLGEIRSVMRSVAIGLGIIHCKNLVHTDIKMENILVTGFDNDTPSDGEILVTKIADLGMVRPPSQGPITSITYRSPEVYFCKPWATATDIWSWGIVYLHLLQAHADFKSPGMFDSLKVEGSSADREDAFRAAMAHEFGLHSVDYYTSDSVSRELLPPKDESRTELDHWTIKLLDLGIPKKDIEAVHAALNPVPDLRPTAMDLWEFGYV